MEQTSCDINECTLGLSQAAKVIPIKDLDVATYLLVDELPDKIVPLLEWFEEYYIGRKNGRKVGRRSPQFPPEIWNLYQRVFINQNRTNNHAEAVNRRLNVQMGITNPTIWSFINCLKKIQSGKTYFMSNWLLLEVHRKKRRNTLITIKEF